MVRLSDTSAIDALNNGKCLVDYSIGLSVFIHPVFGLMYETSDGSRSDFTPDDEDMETEWEICDKPKFDY